MGDSSFSVGNVRISCISDADFDHRLTLDRLFPSVQVEAWGIYRRRYPRAFGAPGAWHVNMGCYVLRSQGRTILVDTGIGPAGGAVAKSVQAPAGGQLIEKLESAGIGREEVDVVFFTHLHRDHVGWNLRQEDGQSRLTFPHARYVVHQADWDTFHRPDVQASMGEPFVEHAITPLQRLGGLDLSSGDHRITDEVTAIQTPGHTPGHRSVLIVSRGQSAVITGDILVHPAQVADADCAFFFDMDVAVARHTRRRLLERIETEDITMAGGHFPAPGFGRLARENGRLGWQEL